jgi:hypothetical protein
MAADATDALRELQQWYVAQCDGDWEHHYGIKVGTLDNPGWSLRIDLAGTSRESAQEPMHRIERTEFDWVHWRVADKCFEAFCGPANLADAIRAFLTFTG